MRIRLMTYNIHKGIGGVDRRYRPERIARTIDHYQPDLLLLQEVDDGVPRSRLHRQVDYFAKALGFGHQRFQANVVLRRGAYGNAILSRFPLHDTQDVNLTIPLKKCRRAIVTRCRLRIDGHTRTLVVSNVHLGLAGFERVLQIRRLLASHALSHVQRQTALVIAGDFNDVWGTLGKRLLSPLGFKAAIGRVKTFPAALPMRALDRVYYRGNIRLMSSFQGHTKIARQASDHLPVIADFFLPE